MKDIILQAFVAVITSAGVSAVAIFILKTYLEHRIRFRFDQQLADFKSEHDKQLEGVKADYERQLAFIKSQLDAQQEMQTQLLVGQFEARRELLGLVYACRDLARKIAENGDPDVFHDLRQKLEKATAGFYDCLYNCQRRRESGGKVAV